MYLVTGYHAHVYYSSEQLSVAEQVISGAEAQLPVTVGRMHKKLVGPHPKWSCVLVFAPDCYAEVVNWVSQNRQGLEVLVHPETGDDLRDHTDFAVWMGSVLELNLGVFKPS